MLHLLRSATPFRLFRSATLPRILFNLTDVGEGIAQVELLKWFIKENDDIDEFDRVCEVQSDKATVEISSRYKGKVKKLFYKVGDIARVGQPLIELDQDSPASTSSPAPAQAPSPSAAPSGHTNFVDAGLAQVKASTSDSVLTTPAVRRLARENSIDLTKVRATGKGDRIMKEDVIKYLEMQGQQQSMPTSTPAATSSAAGAATAPTIAATASAAAAARPAKAPTMEEERVPVRGLMRTMIKTMTEANNIPSFGFHDEVVMDELIHLRKQAQQQAGTGVKLTYMPFVIKALSLALLEFPIMNSSLSSNKEEVIYKRHHHIGIAMDTPAGLLVPNIKNVELRSVVEIASELVRLQGLGVAGKLSASDLSDGTITISNVGMIGGTYVRPILMPPQVGIVGMGKIYTVAKFDAQSQVRPVQVMNISWSADHRIIDGATIARFSSLWKKYLEQPHLMTLKLR